MMEFRMDSEKYGFGCRRMENFIPKVYGGAYSRPGRLFLGDCGDASAEVRLIPFTVSVTESYMLELGDTYLRVWGSDGELELDEVTSPFTNILSLTTPYDAADLFQIRVVQLNNVMFFTHPDYPIQKLTRAYSTTVTAFEWTFEELDFFYPCFRRRNDTAVTVTPSATTGTIDVTFSDHILNEVENLSEYVGAEIQINQRRDSSAIECDLATNTTSSTLEVLGDYTVYTYGNWAGDLYIEKKDKAGNWEAIKSFKSTVNYARNIVYESFEADFSEMRLRSVITGFVSAPIALMEANESTIAGRVEITSMTTNGSGNPVATCTVLDTLDSLKATTDWALSAWAGYSGYPRAITYHEQRLWFGGTKLDPNTFWASKIDDFSNFRRGPYDNDALLFTIAADESNAIQSMLSHESLIIFTQTDEWTVSTSEKTTITPSNIFVRRQSSFGSAAMQSFIANNNILFLQRGGRKLRDFNYSNAEGGGVSNDLTLLSEHITLGDIKQIAFQQHPDPIVWMVTETGTLLSMTYEAREGVIAWASHPSTGTVESVAIIYGDTSDEVWIVSNLNSSRHVERFNPDAYSALDNSDLASMVYLDSAVVQTSGTPFTAVTGLDHLDGLEVSIVADNNVVPSQTVSSGSLTLTDEASRVVVGLPYTPLLQPSRTELQLQNGTSEGGRFICSNVILKVEKTYGIEVADDDAAAEDDWFAVDFDNLEALALFTGTVEHNNQGSHKEALDVSVRQKLPFPCNLLAMVLEFDVTVD